MGLIRKSLSIATGGLLVPGLVQYRSDTERGTRQVKLLRQDEERRHQELLALEAGRSVNQQGRVAQNSPAPVRQSAHVPQRSETQGELLAQIERLHALHLVGALTLEEFEAEKRARINQISGL